MSEYVILVSVPGLRARDLEFMPHLTELMAGGDQTELVPSFPAVTCPVQANITTGVTPQGHGVVANGFYWREQGEVEMWTAANDCIMRPQLWDILHQHDSTITSAVWFPLHSKQCGADYVCTPAPIHNPDGSESLWCYTRPESLYGELRDKLGHFPLHKFWGPMAGIESTAWIVDSAIHAASEYQPNLFYLYLPHLDYAAQKIGPNSEAAQQALIDLDQQIEKLIARFTAAYAPHKLLWLVASEYAITPVEQVIYPNRVLREAGLLEVIATDDGEQLDLTASSAWALVDHQFAHIFVRDAEPQTIQRAAAVLRSQSGVAEVLSRDQYDRYELDHPRSGDLIVISEPTSWLAYYWWLEDTRAPGYARTVDIHRKPGYDPVELFFDAETRTIPLDASLVRGSHGAPARDPSQRGILLASQQGVFVECALADTDVADTVLRQFGI
ncbi:MAG: nucleotide pyrophosphatase/phosphodiesterase family protein [Pirellulales bacterium]